MSKLQCPFGAFQPVSQFKYHYDRNLVSEVFSVRILLTHHSGLMKNSFHVGWMFRENFSESDMLKLPKLSSAILYQMDIESLALDFF
jgi:hypothetical protein